MALRYLQDSLCHTISAAWPPTSATRLSTWSSRWGPPLRLLCRLFTSPHASFWPSATLTQMWDVRGLAGLHFPAVSIASLLLQYPGEPWYVIGHSMGAAMATLCALDLRFRLQPVPDVSDHSHIAWPPQCVQSESLLATLHVPRTVSHVGCAIARCGCILLGRRAWATMCLRHSSAASFRCAAQQLHVPALHMRSAADAGQMSCVLGAECCPCA